MIESIKLFIIQEPSYVAITLMLSYSLFKINHTKVVESLVAMIIIIGSLILQSNAFQKNLWEKMYLENKISYYEKALEENNIQASTYNEYKEKEQIFKKMKEISLFK